MTRDPRKNKGKVSSRITPSVQRAYDAISGEIFAGNLSAGNFLPSELSLSESLGISRGVVRQAIEMLMETGLVSRKSFSRPVVEHQVFATTSRGVDVHVWVSHPIANEISLRFMRGISRGLAGTEYRMIVREPTRFYGNHVKNDERTFLEALLKDAEAAGAIVQRDAFATNDDLFAEISRRKLPLIFADVPPPRGIIADCVSSANSLASRRCVEHLISIGHRNIVCIADSTVPGSTLERIKGYERAMEQAGLSSLSQVISAETLPPLDGATPQLSGPFAGSVASSPLFQDWAARAVHHLLTLDPVPSAVFLTCDVLAYWFSAIFEGTGRTIPKDLSVVGFDWIAGSDSAVEDRLSTAAQDFESIGFHASDLLLDRMQAPSEMPSRHVLVDAPLVIRKTTCPPAFTQLGPQAGLS